MRQQKIRAGGGLPIYSTSHHKYDECFAQPGQGVHQMMCIFRFIVNAVACGKVYFCNWNHNTPYLSCSKMFRLLQRFAFGSPKINPLYITRWRCRVRRTTLHGRWVACGLVSSAQLSPARASEPSPPRTNPPAGIQQEEEGSAGCCWKSTSNTPLTFFFSARCVPPDQQSQSEATPTPFLGCPLGVSVAFAISAT